MREVISWFRSRSPSTSSWAELHVKRGKERQGSRRLRQEGLQEGETVNGAGAPHVRTAEWLRGSSTTSTSGRRARWRRPRVGSLFNTPSTNTRFHFNKAKKQIE